MMSSKANSRSGNKYVTKQRGLILVSALVTAIGFTGSVLADDEQQNQLQFSFEVKTDIERISPDIPTGFGMPMKYSGTAEIIKITKDPIKKL